MKWLILCVFIILNNRFVWSTNYRRSQFVMNTWPFTQATEKAWQTLTSTDNVLEAVERGCAECESERCDGTVGYGGSPDESGETTLDALIMDGASHRAGSVAGLRRVKNAIGVARAVMNFTRHTLLVGDLATQFALEMGFGDEDLHSVESMKRWIEWAENSCQPNFRDNVEPDPRASCGPYKSRKDFNNIKKSTKTLEKKKIDRNKWHDTIGMIAVDSKGNIAVGTSSNGAIYKVPGYDAELTIRVFTSLLMCLGFKIRSLSIYLRFKTSRRRTGDWQWRLCGQRSGRCVCDWRWRHYDEIRPNV